MSNSNKRNIMNILFKVVVNKFVEQHLKGCCISGSILLWEVIKTIDPHCEVKIVVGYASNITLNECYSHTWLEYNSSIYDIGTEIDSRYDIYNKNHILNLSEKKHEGNVIDDDLYQNIIEALRCVNQALNKVDDFWCCWEISARQGNIDKEIRDTFISNDIFSFIENYKEK
jgi:hypothetical protein